MKNNQTNRILSATFAATLFLSTGSAYADQSDIRPVVSDTAPKVISTNAFDMPAYFIINDKTMKFNAAQTPFASPSGQVMVPLKLFSTELGYKVSWIDSEKTVHLEHNGFDYGFKMTRNDNHEFKLCLLDDEGREYTASVQAGSLYVTPDFFSNAMNGVVLYDHDNQLRLDADRYVPKEASTVGEITKIEQGKDGVQILVKGSKYGEFGFDEISLAVSRTSKIKLSNGKELATGELKVGDQIYVVYNMAVTKSMPPMSQAQNITVLKDEAILTGKVFFKQSSEEKYPTMSSGFAPTTQQLRIVGTGDYFLTLSKDAVIVGEDGSAKSFEDIKEGSLVRVFMAPFAAMSYPAQSTAYRIEIIK